MKDMDMLLKTGKKVWFYLKDQQTQGIFAKEVTRLGGCYGDGTPVRAENCATVMAVRPNLEVARVQLLIWDASFREDFAARYLADASSILKVDYAKFLAGAEDYVCAGSAEGAVPQQTFSGSSGVSGAV